MFVGVDLETLGEKKNSEEINVIGTISEEGERGTS